MSSDILAVVPFKSDPSLNTLLKNFFYALENLFLSKFISRDESERKGGPHLAEKGAFTNRVMMDLIRRLQQKRI
jgi:hypothetical protein